MDLEWALICVESSPFRISIDLDAIHHIHVPMYRRSQFSVSAGNHNCFWQLHWHNGFEEPENYIKLTINDEGGFRIEPRDIPNTKATNSFNLRVEVEFRKADKIPYYLNVDFYIDNKYLASTRKLTDSKPYFKFGVYTLESKCDITHIFNNVKVEYQPYGAVPHIDQPLYLYKDENGNESYVTKSYIKEGEPVT